MRPTCSAFSAPALTLPKLEKLMLFFTPLPPPPIPPYREEDDDVPTPAPYFSSSAPLDSFGDCGRLYDECEREECEDGASALGLEGRGSRGSTAEVANKVCA